MPPAKRATLPDQLRRLVRDSGRTAGQLARASDVDESQISRWMKGERDLRLESAGRLAEALNVEPLRASRRPARPKAPPRVPARLPGPEPAGDPGAG